MKNKIKSFFFDRAPNTIVDVLLFLEFSDIPKEKIMEALADLEDENFLESSILPPNPRFPGLERTVYRVAEGALGQFPMKSEIEAAGIKIPRMIDGDGARAEDINSLILSVNKIIEENSRNLEEKIEEQNKKYWAALITIFALFVSLFSIINVGIKPILFSEELSLSPGSLAFQSFLNIAPLTIVLLLFVWLLHKVLK